MDLYLTNNDVVSQHIGDTVYRIGKDTTVGGEIVEVHKDALIALCKELLYCWKH